MTVTLPPSTPAAPASPAASVGTSAIMLPSACWNSTRTPVCGIAPSRTVTSTSLGGGSPDPDPDPDPEPEPEPDPPPPPPWPSTLPIQAEAITTNTIAARCRMDVISACAVPDTDRASSCATAQILYILIARAGGRLIDPR